MRSLLFVALAGMVLFAMLAPSASATTFSLTPIVSHSVYDTGTSLNVNWTVRVYIGTGAAPTNTTTEACSSAPCRLVLWGIDSAGNVRDFPSTTSWSVAGASGGSPAVAYVNQSLPAQEWREVNACASVQQSDAFNGVVFVGCDHVPHASLYEARTATYANATWEGQVHANATFEGQPHANATWCTLAGCSSVANAVSNDWFNGTSATWESRTHANATFEGQPHANGTWESQVHANDTFCKIVDPSCAGVPGPQGDPGPQGPAGAGCDFGCVNETWFNGTFRENASFGNITAFGITIYGWTNTTDLSLQSALVVETAMDPYIPILLWGGLVIFFLWVRAVLPAVGAVVALGNAILPTPIWITAASVMLIVILLILHVALTRGVIPGLWGRKESP